MEINISDEETLGENSSGTANLSDFIPLHCNNKPLNHKNKANKNFCNSSSRRSEAINDDILIIERPVPRSFRPIVIDGSNVAIE